MDMDSYDGPMVAVLVRTASSMLGTAMIEVVSVHLDADTAALALARRIVAGEAVSTGWQVVTVPAPDLDGDETRPLIPTEDEAERYKMSKIVGLSTDQITPSWRAIRAQARRTRDLGGESFVAALRDALRPALNKPSAVEDMGRPDLLNLVRSLVEAANTPGGDPTEPDPERLERALRAHWDAHRVTTAWENAPGPDQERELRAVERIVRAYLADPADRDR